MCPCLQRQWARLFEKRFGKWLDDILRESCLKARQEKEDDEDEEDEENEKEDDAKEKRKKKIMRKLSLSFEPEVDCEVVSRKAQNANENNGSNDRANNGKLI